MPDQEEPEPYFTIYLANCTYFFSEGLKIGYISTPHPVFLHSMTVT